MVSVFVLFLKRKQKEYYLLLYPPLLFSAQEKIKQ